MAYDIWKLTTGNGRPTGDNKYLWSNRGTWWIAFTVTDGLHKLRIRRSLKTHDLEKARRIRDNITAKLYEGISIKELNSKKQKYE